MALKKVGVEARKDLEDFSQQDFTVAIGGPQCIAAKNLLVGESIIPDFLYWVTYRKYFNFNLDQLDQL